MNAFEQRTLSNTSTLGEHLRHARESQRISLEQIAGDLKIRTEYIRALESSDYNSLPSSVFIKNYTRKYAQYLKLNSTTIDELLEAELQVYTDKPTIPTLKGHLTKRPLRVAQVVGTVGVLLLILAVVTYFSFEISSSIQPPDLTIDALPEQVEFENRSIVIAGQTAPEAIVLINGQDVAVKENGSFSQPVTLQSGVNVFKISVRAKRSREHIEYHQVVLDESKNN